MFPGDMKKPRHAPGLDIHIEIGLVVAIECDTCYSSRNAGNMAQRTDYLILQFLDCVGFDIAYHIVKSRNDARIDNPRQFPYLIHDIQFLAGGNIDEHICSGPHVILLVSLLF